jgi:integrase
MASLQKKGESWYCQFLYHGKRHTFTIGKVEPDEAESKANQVDYLLMRIRQGLLTVPPETDIVLFLQHDGKPPEPTLPTADESPSVAQTLTLGALRDRYLRTHENGSLEQTTIDGINTHFRHLVTTLGERFPIHELGMADLQQHIDRRAKMKGVKGGKLSPATIKKEIISLRTVWNWGVNMRLVTGRFPAAGLTYPKFHDKPPFQTREEIERRIQAGGLTRKETAELWDSLYLTLADVQEVVGLIGDNALQAWVHPMCCFAAYTGARRAEMLRAMVTDVDLAGQTVLLRERKRAKGRATTRRVPLAPQLGAVLKDWLAVHPGGQHLFFQAAAVVRSKTTRKGVTPITSDEAHDHFKRALAATKWNVVRGYHVFRHSFISLAASRGVDQRLIDDWVGHQTDEQRRRYRHLYPTTQQQAISRMFGN